MALNFDLDIEQGSDYAVTFPILDDDGQPVDVTGWMARAQIRRHPKSPVVRVMFNTLDAEPDAAGLAIDGDKLHFRILGSVSARWAWTEGSYEVELVSPSDSVTRLVSGRVFVSPEVTR